MPVPNKIKIQREEDYHTHFIGKTGDGRQFMALIGATLPVPLPEDWEHHKKWYAILHTFDAGGKHLDTQTVCTGRAVDGEDQVIDKAQSSRTQMLAALGDISFEDVEVELFSVEVDGHTFGLVDTSVPHENTEKVDLLPHEFSFAPPWDGSYTT